MAETSVIGGAVANHMRVMLDFGSKGKKVVALAPDWPGLARGAATEQAAIERVRAYVPRYAAVAKLAGMHHRRRRGRALSGHRLNRLLGYIVRVFEHRPATHTVI
jgi:hypothetical protein